eukprot:COSAG01_NODE_96_length_26789_cov_36.697089_9_plen_171_part_00
MLAILPATVRGLGTHGAPITLPCLDRLELKKGKAYARYKEALADAESGAMDGSGGVLSHYDDIDPVTGEPRKAGAADGREVTDTFQLGEVGIKLRYQIAWLMMLMMMLMLMMVMMMVVVVVMLMMMRMLWVDRVQKSLTRLRPTIVWCRPGRRQTRRRRSSPRSRPSWHR